MKTQNILREKVIQAIDVNTGELVEQTTDKLIKVKKEPDFIKLYLDCMISFIGAKNVPSTFLMELCKYVTYANNDKEQMRATLTMAEKESISKSLGLSTSMINRYIRNCLDSGILFKTKHRASFIVNPFLIAKCEWNNIKELRAEFDFTSGTWSYTKGVIADDTE